MVVATGLDEMLCPEFGKIKYLLVDDNDEPIFICEKLNNLGFNAHAHAFEVKESNAFYIVRGGELYDRLPLWNHMTAKGESYIVIKYVI